MAHLADIARFLDETLDVKNVPDYSGALNGVQVENRQDITRVAVAVDASLRTIDGTIADGAQLLIVHHGLFWSGAQPITGKVYERMHRLVTHDVAVYSSHIPLDLHPTLGNNALLARRLGLDPTDMFGRYQNVFVGVAGNASLATAALAAELAIVSREHGGSLVTNGILDGRQTRKWAIVTGAGASSQTLREALDAGVDTLIVGEGPHHTGVEADELGIAVLYAGHYATETFGVMALGAEVERQFGIPFSFVAAPTGL